VIMLKDYPTTKAIITFSFRWKYGKG